MPNGIRFARRRMRIDLESVAPGQTFRSKLCIIGAGVAGLTLAAKLADSAVDVCLLEAGGLQYEDRCQQLYDAEMAGHRHSGTTLGRFRVFGGSSTRWGGQLLPYTDDVFHPPPELNLPDWPIDLSDIDPYYAEVGRLLGASQQPFTDDLLRAFSQGQPFQSADVRLRYSKWAPFGKRNLARTLGKTCSDSSRVTVFLHANVKSIELAPGGTHIRSVIVQNPARQCSRFEASLFILSAGTIETCRLLLSSSEVAPEGVGNDRDQVGRYFHDHLSVEAAALSDATRRRVLRYFTPRFTGGTLHTPKLEASAQLRAKGKLLSVMAHFPIEEPEDSGFRAVQQTLRQMQSGNFDKKFYKSVVALPTASVQIAKLVIDSRFYKKRSVSEEAKVTLHLDCEQRPQAESRIRLGQSRDSLGMRRALVDWRISEEERHTISAYAAVINRIFTDNNIGELTWHPELFETDKTWLRFASDTFHMMGGTRMGTSPSTSVVDKNLKVHGIDNLYIASCSVFPTGGSSNPTFTMMALTLRLADKLRRACLP